MWHNDNELCPIDEVALCWAMLVLGWVTACRQVNISICNEKSSLTQPSIPLGLVNQVSAYLAGVKVGAFTCVRWQVTLCDSIWQVMLHSSEMGFL